MCVVGCSKLWDSTNELKRKIYIYNHVSQVFIAVNGYSSESGELNSQHGVRRADRLALRHLVNHYLVNWRVPFVTICF